MHSPNPTGPLQDCRSLFRKLQIRKWSSDTAAMVPELIRAYRVYAHRLKSDPPVAGQPADGPETHLDSAARHVVQELFACRCFLTKQTRQITNTQESIEGGGVAAMAVNEIHRVLDSEFAHQFLRCPGVAEAIGPLYATLLEFHALPATLDTPETSTPEMSGSSKTSESSEEPKTPETGLPTATVGTAAQEHKQASSPKRKWADGADGGRADATRTETTETATPLKRAAFSSWYQRRQPLTAPFRTAWQKQWGAAKAVRLEVMDLPPRLLRKPPAAPVDKTRQERRWWLSAQRRTAKRMWSYSQALQQQLLQRQAEQEAAQAALAAAAAVSAAAARERLLAMLRNPFADITPPPLRRPLSSRARSLPLPLPPSIHTPREGHGSRRMCQYCRTRNEVRPRRILLLASGLRLCHFCRSRKHRGEILRSPPVKQPVQPQPQPPARPARSTQPVQPIPPAQPARPARPTPPIINPVQIPTAATSSDQQCPAGPPPIRTAKRRRPSTGAQQTTMARLFRAVQGPLSLSMAKASALREIVQRLLLELDNGAVTKVANRSIGGWMFSCTDSEDSDSRSPRPPSSASPPFGRPTVSSIPVVKVVLPVVPKPSQTSRIRKPPRGRTANTKYMLNDPRRFFGQYW